MRQRCAGLLAALSYVGRLSRSRIVQRLLVVSARDLLRITAARRGQAGGAIEHAELMVH